MRRHAHAFPVRVAALLLAVVLPCVRAAAQEVVSEEDAEGTRIVEVVLQGNVLVDHFLLKSNLKTQPGGSFSKRDVNDDTLWMHDNYGIVTDGVRVERVAGGVTVTFPLRRILQHDFVEFQGNDEFSDSKLRDVARLPDDRPVSPPQVVSAQSLIREHYQSKGFPFVQVEVRPKTRENGERGAAIRVFEGPEVELTELRIEGLDAVDEDDARDLLESQPGWWSWLVAKDFVRADVDRDILVLEDFVRREGYLDASVSLEGLSWSDDRTEVVVTLLVDQGPRYSVRSVVVTGNTALTEEELKLVQTLAARDREVRTHEQAHQAVGGRYAGSPSYEYQSGPDGKRYAVGGEVPIDIGEAADPAETVRKMEVVRRAALAPAEPSGQDRAVAAQATQIAARARAELQQQQAEEAARAREDEATEAEDPSAVEGDAAPADAASDPNAPAQDQAAPDPAAPASAAPAETAPDPAASPSAAPTDPAPPTPEVAPAPTSRRTLDFAPRPVERPGIFLN